MSSSICLALKNIILVFDFPVEYSCKLRKKNTIPRDGRESPIEIFFLLSRSQCAKCTAPRPPSGFFFAFVPSTFRHCCLGTGFFLVVVTNVHGKLIRWIKVRKKKKGEERWFFLFSGTATTSSVTIPLRASHLLEASRVLCHVLSSHLFLHHDLGKIFWINF